MKICPADIVLTVKMIKNLTQEICPEKTLSNLSDYQPTTFLTTHYLYFYQNKHPKENPKVVIWFKFYFVYMQDLHEIFMSKF